MYSSFDLPKPAISFPYTANDRGKTNDSSKVGANSSRTAHVRPRLSHSSRIVLNVGGRRYEVSETLFFRFPDTMLGSMAKDAYYDHANREYFFDRDPDIFRSVLNYFRTGKFHIPEEECFAVVLDEMKFYKIPLESALTEECFLDHPDEAKAEKAIMDSRVVPQSCELVDLGANSSPCGTTQSKTKYFQQKLGDFVNNPQSSLAAIAYSYIVTTLTLLNVAIQIAETVACGKGLTCGEKYEEIFFTTDALCVIVFTADYLVRLLGSPRRLRFVTSTMNIVDLLAVSPFYVGLVMTYTSCETLCSQDYYLMAVLRVLRIFRILKLSKSSDRLQRLTKACTGGLGEMLFFLLAVSLVIILSSTLVYFMESREKNTKFSSIPDTMWYTTVTLTSLG